MLSFYRAGFRDAREWGKSKLKAEGGRGKADKPTTCHSGLATSGVLARKDVVGVRATKPLEAHNLPGMSAIICGNFFVLEVGTMDIISLLPFAHR
jgi:hypothetical protein